MEIFKCVDCFLCQMRTCQSKVEDSLDAIGLDTTNRLKIQIFCRVKVAIDKDTISFVEKCLPIVAVTIKSNRGVLRSLFNVAFEETYNQETGCSGCLDFFLFLLQSFQYFDGDSNSLRFLAAELLAQVLSGW